MAVSLSVPLWIWFDLYEMCPSVNEHSGKQSAVKREMHGWLLNLEHQFFPLTLSSMCLSGTPEPGWTEWSLLAWLCSATYIQKRRCEEKGFTVLKTAHSLIKKVESQCAHFYFILWFSRCTSISSQHTVLPRMWTFKSLFLCHLSSPIVVTERESIQFFKG